MHRLVLNPPSDKDIDHINSDGLDNQKINLRVCSRAENARYKRPRLTSKTGYKGVYFLKGTKRTKPWRAVIGINGKAKSIGQFATAEEAAEAYNQKAKEAYGRFAYLNKVRHP